MYRYIVDIIIIIIYELILHILIDMFLKLSGFTYKMKHYDIIVTSDDARNNRNFVNDLKHFEIKGYLHSDYHYYIQLIEFDMKLIPFGDNTIELKFGGLSLDIKTVDNKIILPNNN